MKDQYLQKAGESTEDLGQDKDVEIGWSLIKEALVIKHVDGQKVIEAKEKKVIAEWSIMLKMS